MNSVMDAPEREKTGEFGNAVFLASTTWRAALPFGSSSPRMKTTIA
jgi:hypothetical protein